MSSPFVLTSARFPDSTAVSAYAQSDWAGPPPSDGDVAYATAVETQTTSGNSATFVALNDNTSYYAGATVNAATRYVRFHTGDAPTASQNLSGTAATRPAASAVVAGTTYFATDTFVLSESNHVTWTTLAIHTGSSGVASARPAASAVAGGSVYFATDTGVLSMSDHSTWTTTSQGPARKVNTVADATATYTVPAVTTGTVHQITLTVSSTFTFPTVGAGKEFYIALKQGPTGSFAVTWPVTVLWPAATAPTLTTTSGKTDLLHFISADGTNWIGRAVAQNL